MSRGIRQVMCPHLGIIILESFLVSKIVAITHIFNGLVDPLLPLGMFVTDIVCQVFPTPEPFAPQVVTLGVISQVPPLVADIVLTSQFWNMNMIKMMRYPHVAIDRGLRVLL